MNLAKSLRAERLIAKRYEEAGYVVTLEPAASALPFSLGNYVPDILAVKGDERILIEVKTAGARGPSETYLRVDQEVQKHPGWQFFIVTVNDEELTENASGSGANTSLESIRAHLRSIDRLVEDHEVAGLLLPILWTAYVAAVRLLAQREGTDLNEQSDLSLINKAYSEGLISFDQYESAKRLLALRNRAVHSLGNPATQSDARQLRQLIETVLDKVPTVSDSSP